MAAHQGQRGGRRHGHRDDRQGDHVSRPDYGQRVFAFIINGDPTVKQFGVGMGVAVAVDATIVRGLLVPAVMVLVGRANWWFPPILDRIIPNFSIEGEEWFRQRDAAASAAAAERRELERPPVAAS